GQWAESRIDTGRTADLIAVDTIREAGHTRAQPDEVIPESRDRRQIRRPTKVGGRGREISGQNRTTDDEVRTGGANTTCNTGSPAEPSFATGGSIQRNRAACDGTFPLRIPPASSPIAAESISRSSSIAAGGAVA